MRFHSYLNSAKKIIESNKGEEPFALFLKKYFAANKKYGSKDRKQVAALCYNFYRLGKAMPGVDIEDKIFTATFLTEQVFSDFLHFHKPGLNELIDLPLSEKISIAGLDIKKIFPWINELSDGVDHDSYCTSFFFQPDLFLRIRPGKMNIVSKKLKDGGLDFSILVESCISLPNTTKLDSLIELDREAVVQDLNSQKVLDILKNDIPVSVSTNIKVWDCCAASGGKSILVFDNLNGKIELTVSDIRESILANLKKRFSAAGIKNYNSFIADLSAENHSVNNQQYSVIICDAPCTGSGTWSRTPEQLYYFKEEMIAVYSEKQRKIVSNVIPQLKEGGMFIYITCSVFKKENEEIADFIKEKFHLELMQMELVKGYDKKADSMFTAAFIKK